MASNDQSQGNHQPNVRHIPIFIEGRDQPIVNKDNESTQKSSSGGKMPTMPSHENDDFFNRGSLFDRTKDFPIRSDMTDGLRSSFGSGMPDMYSMPQNDDFFNRGSIFDRARDFPVRTFGNMNNMRQPSPNREPSPGRHVPVFNVGPSPTQQHQQTHVNDNSFHRNTPPPQQQPQMPQDVTDGAAHPHRQLPQTPQQQQQQPQQPQPQPVKEDSITKIQKIQQDVLDLMDQVEKFQGSGPKDKTYLYLEEMLTRNLLKLDNIDAEGQEHIRQARKEAIKCINHCISVLEAKAEAAVSSAGSSANNSTNNLNSSGNNMAGNKSNSVSHSSSTSSQK